ncbi:MAG: hypothetical protein RLZZ490_1357 [Cyanobacteriota bacterium]
MKRIKRKKFHRNLDVPPPLGDDNNSEFKPPQAELAELVDALDSGSSVRKDFRVQVPGSALFGTAVGIESCLSNPKDGDRALPWAQLF